MHDRVERPGLFLPLTQIKGPWSLVPGPWSLVPGPWSLVHRPASREFCPVAERPISGFVHPTENARATLVPMKTIRRLLCVIPLITALAAQDPARDPATAEVFAPQFTPDQLEQLLGPIALYPDALIAIILPASTAPADIVLAARHLRDNPGDLSQVEHRAWDDSVKSLTRYPEVLRWLDENLTWTQQVGEAFLAQPAEVMQAIQRLRGKAQAAGTLVDTPQQVVIAEPEVIRIVPAQPDTIYVPYYDPAVVFIERPVYYSRPFISFSTGFAVGSWLAYDCDWRHRTIWVGDRHRPWFHHNWRQPLIPFRPPHVHSTLPSWQWRPSLRLRRPVHPHHRGGNYDGPSHSDRPDTVRPPVTRTPDRRLVETPQQQRNNLRTRTLEPEIDGNRIGRNFTGPTQHRPRPETRTSTIIPPPGSRVAPASQSGHPAVQTHVAGNNTGRKDIVSITPQPRTPSFSDRGGRFPAPSSRSTVSFPRTLRTPASVNATSSRSIAPFPGSMGSPQMRAPLSSGTRTAGTLRTLSPGSSRASSATVAPTPGSPGARPPSVGLPPQSAG